MRIMHINVYVDFWPPRGFLEAFLLRVNLWTNGSKERKLEPELIPSHQPSNYQ